MRKKRIFWTKENCAIEAFKYNTRNNFRLNSKSAYNAAWRNGWLDDICEHINLLLKKWNYEDCLIDARKYLTRNEFRKKSSSAYNKSLKMNWLDDVCKHMPKNNNHWIKENCAKEALKYKTKAEFGKKSRSAYTTASKNKWIDEICQHMKSVGNLKKRCIYAAYFTDNSVYIGLTYSIDNRIQRHLNNPHSSIYKHIIKTNINPEIKQITEYVNIEEAKKLEGYYVNQYKENGWNILNKSKTGIVGGNTLIWTKAKCIEDALKYKNRKEYQKKSSGSYASARINGWLDEVCKHMKYGNRRITEEICLNCLHDCKNISEYRKKYSGKTKAAIKLGIWNKIKNYLF